MNGYVVEKWKKGQMSCRVFRSADDAIAEAYKFIQSKGEYANIKFLGTTVKVVPESKRDDTFSTICNILSNAEDRHLYG